jgi:hypothetical protein
MLPSDGEPEEERVSERKQWDAATIAEMLTAAGYPTRVDDSEGQGPFRFVCWDEEDTVQMVSPMETEDIERRLDFLFPRCRFHANCVFRCKPITRTARSRSLIPRQADHLFQSKPITIPPASRSLSGLRAESREA